MQTVYIPIDEADLMVIKSVLEAGGIPFHVENDHFGSLYPGIMVGANDRKVMVDEENVAEARELINDYIKDNP